MEKLQIFNNPEFGEIRTVDIEGEVWFVGKDVAYALGYSDTNKAVAMHVSDEDKKLNDKSSLSFGQRGVTLINESGLYALIMGSKMKSARRFKHWVTSDVLPSIRKNGGYIQGQETLTDEELIAKALIVAQNKIAEKNRQIEQLRPKEIFADAVAASDTSILVGDLAKILHQNGVKMGQQRLFEYFRKKGYLSRRTAGWIPTQKAMERGLFEVKETTIRKPSGHIEIRYTSKVTGKGQQYFINKFLGESGGV